MNSNNCNKNECNKKIIIIISAVLACMLAVGTCAYFAFFNKETEADNSQQKAIQNAAETEEVLPESQESVSEDKQTEIEPEPEIFEPDIEQKDRHALLLTVPDKSNIRADMIMLMVFRMDDKQIDLISIPRDTKVDGNKINAVAIKNNSIDLELLTSKVENLTGIDVDTYMLADIECVRNTVDLFGGVMFDVPQRMKYSDPYQNLYIDLQKGMQLLDGDKAEQVLRFRRYINGDLDRTEVQRDFMIAAFEQHAKIENLTKIPEWYSLADGHIKTNINEETLSVLAQAVIEGSFTVNSRIMPYSVTEEYVICNKTEMEKMAKELGY